MAQADAEDRDAASRDGDEFKAYARPIWIAGARRKHNGVRPQGERGGRVNLVIALHHDVFPQFTEVMDEIPREAIVIVDQ
jgi:hypothetical protein